MRFCLVWLLAGLVVLSLVSGKQLKYLVPLLPAITLLLGRVLSRMEDAPVRQRPWLLGITLLVTGVACMALPFALHKPAWISAIHPAWGGLLAILAMATFWMRPIRPARYAQLLGVLSVCVVTVLQLGIFPVAAPAYDMRPVSRFIAQLQAEGHAVAVADEYHGQFGFSGRLVQPLEQLDATTVDAWANRHPQGYLVMVVRTPDEFADAVYTQPYRSKYLVIREGRMASGDTGSLR
jgi:4-amino-4-deoxy-L-arabinose transferase-like glycosyltransferase